MLPTLEKACPRNPLFLGKKYLSVLPAVALSSYLLWSLPYRFLRKNERKTKKIQKARRLFPLFHFIFFSPLILVDPKYLILNYQTILGMRENKNEIKRKPNPGVQVMFPFCEGFTLCIILESQPQDCRLAVLPRPQL